MTDSSFRSLPTPALGAAEIALNRYLGTDPRALALGEQRREGAAAIPEQASEQGRPRGLQWSSSCRPGRPRSG